MKHGHDVQQRHYVRTQGTKRDARMSNMFYKYFTGDVVPEEDFEAHVERNNSSKTIVILSYFCLV